MKIKLPTFGDVIKSLVIALLLAIAGFMLYPLLGLEHLAPQRLFSYGLLAGALIGSLLALVKVALAGSDKIESIFVGNLAFKMPAAALRELFEQYGQVHAVRVMTDRITRKPRGFGFIEMNHREARAAIRALNGKEFYGREIKVNIANERKRREDES